jgi:hypothetical protein
VCGIKPPILHPTGERALDANADANSYADVDTDADAHPDADTDAMCSDGYSNYNVCVREQPPRQYV